MQSEDERWPIDIEFPVIGERQIATPASLRVLCERDAVESEFSAIVKLECLVQSIPMQMHCTMAFKATHANTFQMLIKGCG